MESGLYKRLKTATRGFHWQRHEDKLVSGIPDTSYGVDGVCGWVELKTYDNWPRDGNLTWSDLKPEQVNWLIARGKTCEHCYILLEIGTDPKTSDWLLISWRHLRKIRTYSKAKLLRSAEVHGSGPIKRIDKVLRVNHGK